MNTAEAIKRARATHVALNETKLVVDLDDGRRLAVPIEWYPRLASGALNERENFRILGDGSGIRSPDLDEDISIESMLAGRPALESESSLAQWKAELERRRSSARADEWGESAPLPDWWDEGA